MRSKETGALRIGLDVDDVLLDLVGTWLDDYNIVWHDNLQKRDITAWEFWQFTKATCGKRIYEFLTPEIYRRVAAFEGAKEFTESIRAMGHNITYVTSCGSDPLLIDTIADAKSACLAREGVSKKGDAFIPASDKSFAPVDLLIDDGLHNIKDFTTYHPGMGILFTAHWNVTDQSYPRADTYDDALALIESL